MAHAAEVRRKAPFVTDVLDLDEVRSHRRLQTAASVARMAREATVGDHRHLQLLGSGQVLPFEGAAPFDEARGAVRRRARLPRQHRERFGRGRGRQRRQFGVLGLVAGGASFLGRRESAPLYGALVGHSSRGRRRQHRALRARVRRGQFLLLEVGALPQHVELLAPAGLGEHHLEFVRPGGQLHLAAAAPVGRERFVAHHLRPVDPQP